MKIEPKRHHYIPQFILKNFCYDDNNHLLYFDKQSGEVSSEDTRDVFMVKNLYRDEINNADNPTKIEKDLAVFENEVSRIIKDKFLSGKDIILTLQENQKLKLFFAIMGFRSKETNHKFGDKISKESKVFYKQYQQDGDYTDLWKRNLGYVVNCRSIEEVLNHPHIDDPFKVFFRRDTVGIFGMYIVVVEAKENDGFVIGDTYPVVISGSTDSGLQLHLYSIHPISHNRTILLADVGAEAAPRYVTNFRDCVLRQPILDNVSGTIKIRVKSLYPEEVQYLNREVAKNSNEGFAFRKEPINLLK